jgi:hypothetical protein
VISSVLGDTAGSVPSRTTVVPEHWAVICSNMNLSPGEPTVRLVCDLGRKVDMSGYRTRMDSKLRVDDVEVEQAHEWASVALEGAATSDKTWPGHARPPATAALPTARRSGRCGRPAPQQHQVGVRRDARAVARDFKTARPSCSVH